MFNLIQNQEKANKLNAFFESAILLLRLILCKSMPTYTYSNLHGNIVLKEF